jgi:hypothetical protein
LTRNLSNAGILVKIKTGSHKHNQAFHNQVHPLSIDDCVPVKCNFQFEHRVKYDKNGTAIDQKANKKGEKPNFFLKNHDGITNPAGIPEDFHKFVGE